VAFLLKACPRCRGDLQNLPDPDVAGGYLQCLQCGGVQWADALEWPVVEFEMRAPMKWAKKR